MCTPAAVRLSPPLHFLLYLNFPCLDHVSRIRDAIGRRLTEGVAKLPIPEKLKEFVLLKRTCSDPRL